MLNSILSYSQVQILSGSIEGQMVFKFNTILILHLIHFINNLCFPYINPF